MDDSGQSGDRAKIPRMMGVIDDRDLFELFEMILPIGKSGES